MRVNISHGFTFHTISHGYHAPIFHIHSGLKLKNKLLKKHTLFQMENTTVPICHNRLAIV